MVAACAYNEPAWLLCDRVASKACAACLLCNLGHRLMLVMFVCEGLSMFEESAYKSHSTLTAAFVMANYTLCLTVRLSKQTASHGQ